MRSLYSSLTFTGYLRLDESQFAERTFGRVLLLGESVDLCSWNCFNKPYLKKQGLLAGNLESSLPVETSARRSCV